MPIRCSLAGWGGADGSVAVALRMVGAAVVEVGITGDGVETLVVGEVWVGSAGSRGLHPAAIKNIARISATCLYRLDWYISDLIVTQHSLISYFALRRQPAGCWIQDLGKTAPIQVPANQQNQCHSESDEEEGQNRRGGQLFAAPDQENAGDDQAERKADERGGLTFIEDHKFGQAVDKAAYAGEQ